MHIIDDMKATRAETLRRFALADADLDRAYGPGKWSVRYVLHHIADTETVLFDRIRRVLSEGRRVLWAFDQDAWAQSLDYQVRPMALSRDLYLASREGAMFYASLCYETKGHLEWVHSETGVRTLKDEFDKVVWHNAKHLEQIAKALGQTPESTRAS